MTNPTTELLHDLRRFIEEHGHLPSRHDTTNRNIGKRFNNYLHRAVDRRKALNELVDQLGLNSVPQFKPYQLRIK